MFEGLKKDNDILRAAADIFCEMKANKPLVECLTNRVTINDCANMLLAMGASPIMAEAECEMEDIMRISSSLVLNLGLLGDKHQAAMKTAARAARSMGKPIILDPVGAGASAYRNEVCADMIECAKPTVIRGNMSEIKSLCGARIESKGVDASGDDTVNAGNYAEYGEMVRTLAKKHSCVVCATGETDVVSDGDRVYYLHNGTDMLCGVTGTGCMCSATIGALCACGDPLAATAAAVIMQGIAGEYAAEYVRNSGEGIGTYRTKLFDYIYLMKADDFMKRGEAYVQG